MKKDDEWAALRLLLEKRNLGIKTVTMKDVEGVLKDDDDIFPIGSNLSEVFQYLEEKNFVRKCGGDDYAIIADIATIREAVLGFADETSEKEAAAGETSIDLEDLWNSEWVAVARSHEEQGQAEFCGEAGSAFQREGDNVRHTYGMNAVRESADENGGGEDEEDEEDEEEDGDEVYEDVDLSGSILGYLHNSVGIEEDGGYVIFVYGLRLCNADVKFELITSEDNVYLCDRGMTLSRLGEPDGFHEETQERMAGILAESGAEFIDGKLCIKVDSAEQTFTCLIRLYSVMDRILHMEGVFIKTDEEEAEIPKEYIQALEYVVRVKKAGLIDLHAEFGFAPHKINLMFDWMEKEGFIKPFDYTTGKREALLTLDEFKRRFGKK